ncbi:YeeE/YedE family protein [Halotalea alkalilenta]|uniref:YeeE/YedE family protein n=1 Tax=Halotalea alkalilenta TaxID=376489 RepID=UPI0004826ED3
MSTSIADSITRPPLRPLVMATVALLIVGALWLGEQVGPAQGALLIVGGALGLVLYHAAFGFTSAWRVFITERRGRGLRAQMAMLSLAVVLFFPVLASGTLFGQPVTGLLAPIGVSVVFGAFIFGIGMQLGGGCASGTLFTVGGGNARMLVTLAFFIIGSLLATIHFDRWAALPHFAPVTLVDTLGPVGGIGSSLALFALIALLTVVLERRRHGSLEKEPEVPRHGGSRWLRGPWPLLFGALALAVLNFITLALSGRPWGITSAFALWGAKGAQWLGIDPSAWAYWQMPNNARALSQSVWYDITTVMDVGIIIGAMLAASLAGRFAPSLRIPARSLVAAVVGGLLLGYGARLAYGCNIGAYFSGIASGSLHGWVWLIAAFFGNAVGVRLRPFFFGPRPGAGAARC